MCERRCPNCNRKMVQQFIGIKHCPIIRYKDKEQGEDV